MKLIKDLDKFFYPRDFKGNPYAWLTNQLSHTFGSLLACIFLPYWFVGSFWIVWEARHFYKTRNWIDMTEDLFYELNGVAFWCFFFLSPQYVVWYAGFYCAAVVFNMIFFKKR